MTHQHSCRNNGPAVHTCSSNCGDILKLPAGWDGQHTCGWHGTVNIVILSACLSRGTLVRLCGMCLQVHSMMCCMAVTCKLTCFSRYQCWSAFCVSMYNSVVCVVSVETVEFCKVDLVHLVAQCCWPCWACVCMCECVATGRGRTIQLSSCVFHVQIFLWLACVCVTQC